MAWHDGYTALKHLEGDRYLVIAPLTFGRARLIVATPDAPGEHW